MTSKKNRLSYSFLMTCNIFVILKVYPAKNGDCRLHEPSGIPRPCLSILQILFISQRVNRVCLRRLGGRIDPEKDPDQRRKRHGEQNHARLNDHRQPERQPAGRHQADRQHHADDPAKRG